MVRHRESKLEPFRAAITGWRQDEKTWEEIALLLKSEQNVQISVRQLCRAANSWSLTSSYINLEPYRSEITEWYCVASFTMAQVCGFLRRRQVDVTERALRRWLKKWGVRKISQRMEDIEGLPIIRARVADLFVRLLYSDEQIVQDLQHQGFTSITKSAVARIRHSQGLVRRTSRDDWEKLRQHMHKAIQDELKRGITDSFGRRLLYVYIRNRHICISRWV
jgi:arginine repressor